MNPYQISEDPAWHRIIDGAVILIIGLAAGVVAGTALMYQYISPSQIQREIITPQVGSGIHTDVPSGVKLEEI